MAKNEMKIYVGADVGFATAKGVVIAYDPLKGKGKLINKGYFPSRLSQGRGQIQHIFGMGSKLSEPVSYHDELSGVDYTIVSNNKSENTRFDGYHSSSLMRVLTQHLMQKLKLNGTVNVTTGLPIEMYYNGSNKKNEKLIEDKSLSLLKNKVMPLEGDFTPVTFSKVNVLPEGVGAYLDFIIDEHGNVNEKLKDYTIAVIDIGGRTTDIYVGKNLFEMDFTRIKGHDIGVLDVLTDMQSWLLDNLNIKEDNLQRLEEMLFTQKYRSRGQELERSSIINCISYSVRNTFSRLHTFVEQVLTAQANDIDKILLVGGGAHIFGQQLLKLYSQAVLVDEPEYANARGFAKYALNVDNS